MNSQDIEYLNRSELIDNDLQLIFIKKDITSAPDITVPVYKFQMIKVNSAQEMGGINLRAGYTENILQFRGNIGFTVFESFRGSRLSGRGCKILKPFIKFLGLKVIWLTCNADNIASKKNLEFIGATYVDTKIVTEDSPYIKFYSLDARVKLRYRWDIT